MKHLIFISVIALLFNACSKSDSTNPTTPPSGGITIKQASRISFGLNDASGYPTQMFAQNSNTSETYFVYNRNTAGTYTVSFHGLGGRQIVGTPRSGATNVVTFDPGVNDTLLINNNGIETMRIILINDNANISNGYISVDRVGLETNAQAAIRLNNYVSNVMPTQKFKLY